MACRVKQEGEAVYTVEPRGFWSSVSHKDLMAAVLELSRTYRIVSVVRSWDWWEAKYLVVVEKK